MKAYELQKVWTTQSVADGAGRRMLTIARGLPQPAPRQRIPVRRSGAVKLTVTSAPEEQSGFEPVIRIISQSNP